MSFHFTDTPGETLPSRREAIDGVADNPISEVRVAYEEELVYTAAKGFSAPYLTSTISNDKKTLSVVRDGGWPKPFDVHVEEPASVPTAGLPWGALYEVDYTALPTQAITNPGSYTIDGKTWWLKGNLSNPGGVLASGKLVNGSGLGLRPNFSVAYTAGGTPNNYLRWWMPFAQLSDFNPAAPVALQFCLEYTGPEVVVAGFGDSTNDAVGPTSAQRPHTTLVGAGSANSTPITAYGQAADASDDPGGSSIRVGAAHTPQADWLFTVVLAAPGIAFGSMNQWAGVFPTVWSVPLSASGNVHVKSAGIGTPSNLGLYLAVKNQSGGGFNDYWLRNLKISQPKVTI